MMSSLRPKPAVDFKAAVQLEKEIPSPIQVQYLLVDKEIRDSRTKI